MSCTTKDGQKVVVRRAPKRANPVLDEHRIRVMRARVYRGLQAGGYSIKQISIIQRVGVSTVKDALKWLDEQPYGGLDPSPDESDES